MLRLLAPLLALQLTLPAWAASAAPAESPYADPNLLVVQARMTALVRSDNPQAIHRGDYIEVSNSCGYDTAIVTVEHVLVGKYDDPELAANLTLGEFCESFLQPSVRDYLLFLEWDGSTWRIRPELSSRLLASADGTAWIVNPELLAIVLALEGPSPEDPGFTDVFLEPIALESFMRLGEFVPALTRPEQIAEMRRQEVRGDEDWRLSPLHFDRGLSIARFREWLARHLPTATRKAPR